MNKELILLGIQWCGKWTQSDLFVKALPSHSYYEMWQVLRSFHSNDNFVWNYLKDIMNRGNLIPHFITHALIDVSLKIAEKENKNLIIDWFPRAMEQAEFLVNKLTEMNRDYVVIHYELSKEKALERMIKRAEIEARKDDNPEAMNRRIEIFFENTLPVLNYFESKGKLIKINADESIENIFQETMNKLKV